MQTEKVATIVLGLIIIGALSSYILVNNWDVISENLFGGADDIEAVDDSVSISINSVNTSVKILDNDKFKDRSKLTIEIVEGPSYGDLSVNETNVTYTPNFNYSGKDSFTYNLIDPSGKKSTATVSIEVAFGVIQNGDCVDVYYIGKFTNGTIFDTNIEDVAVDAGIFDENRTYEIAKVFVNPNLEFSNPDGYEDYSSQFISGFLKGLVGMKEGETQDVTIPPEDAYGIWNKTLAEELFSFYFQSTYWPRKVSNPISEEIPKIRLTDYNTSINVSAVTEGFTFDYIEAEDEMGNTVYWQIQVTNISGENVTIKNLIQNNTILKSEGMWDNVIVIENETHFAIRGDPEYDVIYGSPGFYMKLEDLNETAIVVSINVESPEPKFIGKTLVFQLNAVKVYKTSAELDS